MIPKIHFVDGTYMDIHKLSYEEFIDMLSIIIDDITIQIYKITYIENFEVVA